MTRPLRSSAPAIEVKYRKNRANLTSHKTCRGEDAPSQGGGSLCEASQARFQFLNLKFRLSPLDFSRRGTARVLAIKVIYGHDSISRLIASKKRISISSHQRASVSEPAYLLLQVVINRVGEVIPSAHPAPRFPFRVPAPVTSSRRLLMPQIAVDGANRARPCGTWPENWPGGPPIPGAPCPPVGNLAWFLSSQTPINLAECRRKAPTTWADTVSAVLLHLRWHNSSERPVMKWRAWS
jgi:hypothetical protein